MYVTILCGLWSFVLHVLVYQLCFSEFQHIIHEQVNISIKFTNCVLYPEKHI